jgi:holin-like protein
MVILFLLLKSGIAKVEWVEKPATFLLDNLMLFFIPATVGIALIPYEIIKEDYITIILAAVLSSFLVLWLVGFIVEKQEKSDK